MRCKNCNRIHHELPDILVPYRRYEAESIERTVEDPTAAGIAADESTLRRWRQWFVIWALYAAGCLESISHRFEKIVESSSTLPRTTLQRIGRFVGDAPGWLARTVRPIVNLHLWIQTRSAFLS